VKKVLIDTDVLLDFFFDRIPFSEHAEKLFSLCESGQIEAYVTPVICSNTYYLLRQTASHDRVIEKMNQLLSMMDVLLMDKLTVLDALRSGFKDFEDALQSAAAHRSGFIDVIITRNTKDFARSETGIMTPGSFLKICLHD
jgi:predicted nucleic acid-binding protein